MLKAAETSPYLPLSFNILNIVILDIPINFMPSVTYDFCDLMPEIDEMFSYVPLIPIFPR